MIFAILKAIVGVLLLLGLVFLIYFTTNPNMKRRKK